MKTPKLQQNTRQLRLNTPVSPLRKLSKTAVKSNGDGSV